MIPKKLADMFYIWSDGKTLSETAEEFNMTKVEVFSAFIDDINRFAKEIERILEEIEK